jgi:thiol-disulfide isomerase/thioredoxin
LLVRKLLIALLTIPFLVACSSSDGSVTGSETSFVAGDGTMTLVPAVEREQPVELSGITLEGEPLDLVDYRGKVVVVNVWASWCAPCRAEADELANLAKEFSNESVQFIGLNTRDSLPSAIAFNERFATGFPSIQDKEGELTLAFGKLGPAATPTTIVLDKSGQPAGRILGVITEAQLRNLIKVILEEA